MQVLFDYSYAYVITPQRRQKHYYFRAVSPPHSFVRSPGQILLPRYLMNGLNDVDETYTEYSLYSDDLIRLWMSKVKVTAHRRGVMLSGGSAVGRWTCDLQVAG